MRLYEVGNGEGWMYRGFLVLAKTPTAAKRMFAEEVATPYEAGLPKAELYAMYKKVQVKLIKGDLSEPWISDMHGPTVAT